MARPDKCVLRDATTEEFVPLLPDITVGGFTLRNTVVERTRDTGAPVYQFDIMAAAGERVGRANLVLEGSSSVIRDYGHVCATLAEQLTSGRLLAELVRTLFEVANETGLHEFRLVVPQDHRPSVECCELLRPSGAAEALTVNERQFFVYHYPREPPTAPVLTA